MSSSIADSMKKGYPFINKEFIQKYHGEEVLLVGKVVSCKNNIVTLMLNPKTNSDILINNFKEKLSQDDIVMILGRVSQDNSVEFIKLFKLDESVDLDFVNEYINLSVKHPFFQLVERIKS